MKRDSDAAVYRPGILLQRAGARRILVLTEDARLVDAREGRVGEVIEDGVELRFPVTLLVSVHCRVVRCTAQVLRRRRRDTMAPRRD